MNKTAIFLFTLGVGLLGHAELVSESTARLAVQGWLHDGARHLDKRLPARLAGTRAFADADGRLLYRAIDLAPEGYVIVAADDGLEPIIAFSERGRYERAAANPLAILLDRDLAARKPSPAAAAPALPDKSAGASADRWQRLVQRALRAGFQPDGLLPAWAVRTELALAPVGTDGAIASPTDIRIAPLLQSQWSQSTAQGQYCYNYYTPNHYVDGCVATAMAQLMRYFQFPAAGIGRVTNLIYVDDAPQFAVTRGGDGGGGPYVWTNMPLLPATAPYVAEHWQMIGALCYDAGVAAHMQYAAGGSGAYLDDAANAFTNIFQYSNAVYTTGNNYLLPINANLHAGLSVLLGISSAAGAGHAIVCDGYGYDGGTLYHHLNLGWAGSCDAYYNLPDVVGYTAVDCVVSHVFTNRTGEIISGRILDGSGAPLANATVTAQPQGGGPLLAAVTGSNGYYGIIGVPLHATNTVTVSAAGYPTSSLFNVKVGASAAATYGCITNADLTISSNQPFLSCYPNVVSQIITNGGAAPGAQSYDLWNSGTGALSYTVAEGADWLTVSPGSGASTGEHVAIQVIFTNTESLAPGTYTAIITNAAAGAGGSPKTVTVTLQVRCALNVALNQPAWPVTTGGAAAWFGQGDISHDGVSAAQSGAIADLQQAWIQTVVQGPGTLTFWWKCSSETNYDYLRFYIDAGVQAGISGETAWQQQTYQLAAGVHTLVWDYAKDEYVSSGADAGWVDQAAFFTNQVLACAPTNFTQTITAGQTASNQSYAIWNSGDGILAYSISEAASWLAVTPASGTSTGEHDSIQISFQTSGLATGVYLAVITNSASCASGSPALVTVTLTVNPAPPALECSPTSLSQTITVGQTATTQTYAVWNSGGSSLTYSVSESADWLTVSPTSGASTGEHDTIQVSYQTSGLATGIYTAVVTNSAAGADGSPRLVTVSLTVNPIPVFPAVLACSPSSLAQTISAGQNGTNQSYEIWNAGGGTLNYTIAPNAGWLSVNPAGGASTGEHNTISVAYQTANLTAGVYTAFITNTAAGAGNSPAIITVTLTVTSPPPIPGIPTGVSASDGTFTNQVLVSWQTASNATAYEVWRSAAADLATAGQLGVSTGLTYIDMSAAQQPGTILYYWVRGTCGALAGGFSEPDSGYCATSPPSARWRPLAADFDGDRKADPAVFEESSGRWQVFLSASGYAATEFTLGGAGGTPLALDFDGDGKADPAVYQGAAPNGAKLIQHGIPTPNPCDGRELVLSPPWLPSPLLGGAGGGFSDFPSSCPAELPHFSIVNSHSSRGPSPGSPLREAATAGKAVQDGNWQILLSTRGYEPVAIYGFGGPDYLPVAGDYDGDGKADPAIYCATSGQWLALLSGSDYTPTALEGLGGPDQVPLALDFDGDGKADPAVYQTATASTDLAGSGQAGDWTALLSGSGYLPAHVSAFGGAGFQPVPADYLGLAHANAAIYETASGNWFVLLAADSAATLSLENFGGPDAVPLAADFDGDGKADPAVFDPATATWLVKLSAAGYAVGTLTGSPP
jgi:hypothetical protein